jgi:hypothetical protein
MSTNGPSKPPPGRCRNCKQVIEWQRTASGKRMPVNPRLLTIIDAEGRTVVGRESHFANCPGAAEFRRSSGQRNPALS